MFGFLAKKCSALLDWMHSKKNLTTEDVTQFLSQMEDALREADVPAQTTKTLIADLKPILEKAAATKTADSKDHVSRAVYEHFVKILGGKKEHKPFSDKTPLVIMLMGLQGSGKTSTIAKIAKWLQANARRNTTHKKIIAASVDFQRPAAIAQLEQLAKLLDIGFIKTQSQDPVAATSEILQQAKEQHADIILLDTAGRMHIDDSLMTELTEVARIAKPDHKILVLDAMTGQQSLAVAQSFEKHVGFESAIMTKMDSDTCGGAAFAFRATLDKPIIFIGTGEKAADLEPFVPERIASRILGMGDIATLIERTERTFEKSAKAHHQQVADRLLSGEFTLDDFAAQLDMIGKMGSLQNIVSYLPGASKVSSEELEKGAAGMKRFRAILSSMTQKERTFPKILDPSRKKRIARGSGLDMSHVDELLQKFEQSRHFAKMIKKMGGLSSMFGRK